MNKSRRTFLLKSALAGASAAALPARAQEHHHPPEPSPKKGARPQKREATGAPGHAAHLPLVEMPDLEKLPWTLEDGVKVFHISADVVRSEFLPGRVVDCWGFNGSMPGPLIEINWLTINGEAGPDTNPMLVKQGERVRIRMVNLGMDHHPIHLHGNTFYVTGTEGGRVPQAAWTPQNTVLLGVAQGRDIEFEAKYAGDWMLHCHLPHHMMNQMASMVGPLVHGGAGIQAGKTMEAGMGMIREGHALSENNGPSLGRGLGVGSTYQETLTQLPVTPGSASLVQQSPHARHHVPPPGGKLVPGYPQDMFMVMDEMISKPETHGLRASWTAALMGMMTLVRVLTPEKYDEIQEIKRNWKEQKPATHIHK